jgi:hypothetical protein
MSASQFEGVVTLTRMAQACRINDIQSQDIVIVGCPVDD